MKYKRGITGRKIAFFLAIAFLLFIPLSSSAEMTFTPLSSLEHGLRLPEDVAVAPDGKAYAVDGSQGLIMEYSRKGTPSGSIRISKPTSVAVNTDSLIYVGTNENLSVKILDPSYNVIGSLGKGAGEFKLPRNIAIDKATGDVYVVDQIDQSIKVYASSGTFIKKISDYPNLPQDVTIMNNKIYVIDHPLIRDQWGGTIRGAKVRVFDMDGNVLDAEAFGSYGDQEGQFVRPAGITSDTDGVLYISDSFHGVVLCFQADGTYLGAIQNTSEPMVTPMGVALGEDRRLLIASLNTALVHVFGLEGYTEPEEIDVSPSSLTFSAEQGQTNTPEQNLTVSNTGSETKTYTASKNKDWIVLNSTSLTVDASDTGVIPVGVNISGLTVGIYNGQVTVNQGTGSKSISVTLEILPAVVNPELNVTPGELTFLYSTGGSPPASQTAHINLVNDNGAITWTATTDAGWLSIVPSNGQGTTTVANVSVDTTGLETGDYSGAITVEAPGADGSPATIMVTLNIKHGGMIEVTCNIEEASFSIDGPVNYEGSGMEWTAIEVPDGTYTINYNQVIGYITPLSETKDVSGGGAVHFEGTYTSLAMDADIVVSCGSEYRREVSTVGVFDKEGTMAFSFTPFAEDVYNYKRYVYGVNTALGDVDGDGKEDIVVGLALPRRSQAGVAAYRKNGRLIEGSKFILSNHKYGVNLAAADFDGDGKAEIVTGAGPYKSNSAYVSVYSYDSGEITNRVYEFIAFEVNGGVKVAAGDVDGDGIPELITAAGASSDASALVRVFKIDPSGQSWKVVDTGIEFVAFPGIYGANVTTGDLNGDGTDEIIVASGPDPKGGLNIIKAFYGDGTEFGLEIYDSSIGHGLNVASADVDSDGVAEIVAGLGSSEYNPSSVKIFKADGSLHNIFIAFDDSGCYGAVVSAGDLGY